MGVPINIILFYNSVLYLAPGFTYRQHAGQWSIVDQQLIHFRVPTELYVVYAHGLKGVNNKSHAVAVEHGS